MPAERKPGYDMPYYDWSPLPTRPPLKWPNNARVALCVILSMDHYQWKPTNDFMNGGMPGSQPEWAYKAPESPGGVSGGGRPFPDVIGFSVREYGPRVGIFRVLKILDKYGITPTIAIDALTAENYPYVVRILKERGCEFMAHGVAVNQLLTSKMTPDQEREYIRHSVDSVAKATGTTPRGWMGAEFGESAETAAILADEGVKLRLRLAQRRPALPHEDPHRRPLLHAREPDPRGRSQPLVRAHPGGHLRQDDHGLL